jgi:UPF0042 nucleotide-binding protein
MMTDTPTDAPAASGGGDAAGLARGDAEEPAGCHDSGDPAEPGPAKVVVVTGMSGAGKTLALKALEDLGYEAVDNLPLSLLGAVVLRPDERVRRPLAIGIDIRTRDFGVASMLAEMDRLKDGGCLAMTLVFIDCDDEVLSRRFTETRRRHPLAVDRPLADGICHERELISPLRGRSDLVIDTTALPPAELKRVLAGQFGLDAKPSLTVFVTSFSYRRGLPREADLVFDARFLKNPHYDPLLRPLTGRDPAVAAYVAGDPGFDQFFATLTALLDPLLPRFAAEGKSYLTIAVGCTGGRHRSVVIAEQLTHWLRDRGQRVDLRHRELEEGETK